MSKSIFLLRLLVATLMLGAGSARAFVMIDTAGARELISPASFAEDPEDGRTYTSRHLKLSTKDKSLTGFWLWHRWVNADQPAEAARVWTAGMELKVSEPDGLEQFIKFDRAPNWEAGFLVNRTWHPSKVLPDDLDDGPAWWQSVTIQAGYQQENVEYMPLTNNPGFQSRRARDGTAFAKVTGGLYVNGFRPVGQIAFLLSAEVRRGSNYADLPKVNIASLTTLLPPDADGVTRVTLTKSKTLRWGDLQQDTLYPLIGGVVFTIPADWPLSLLGEVEEKDRGEFYLAPYYRLTPSADSGTARAYGVNLAFRSKTYGKDSLRGKVAIPLSVFVERGRAPGGAWETTSGVSTVFSWGP